MTSRYKSSQLEKIGQKRKGHERVRDHHPVTGAMSKFRSRELKKDNIYQHEDEKNPFHG